MAIIRKPIQSKQYSKMPNHWSRDKLLSIEAKGTLAYITSHAEGYPLTVEQIVAENSNGKHAINSAIKELEARGYLVRTKHRRAGRFAGYDYELIEFPPEMTAADFQRRFSRSGKLRDGKPATKKTTTKKTKDLEDQDQKTMPSLSSGHVATVATSASVPQQRERDDVFSNQKFKSHVHRLFAKLNWQVESEVDYIVGEIEMRYDVRGVGFYIEADRNGTLADLIQEVIDDWLAEHPQYNPDEFVNGIKPDTWTTRKVANA